MFDKNAFEETFSLFATQKAHLTKWDKRGIFAAKMNASFSKDPSTKCGCAIMRSDNTFAGFGCNGLARNVDDSLIVDRDFKIACVIHAEENAILNSYGSLQNCTAYVWGLPCCGHCMAMLAQKGITRVVGIQLKNREDWKYSFAVGLKIAYDCDINYEIFQLENIDSEIAHAYIPEFKDDDDIDQWI